MFKKQKLDIPDNFVDIVQQYINIEVEDSTLKNVIKFYNRLGTEQYNVIVEYLCNHKSIFDIAASYELSVDCCESYVNDFYWKTVRKLGIVEDTRTNNAVSNINLTKNITRESTINDLYIKGHIGEKGYRILLIHGFNTFGDLLDKFETNRLELFQTTLRGCESSVIYNFTELCEEYLEG